MFFFCSIYRTWSGIVEKGLEKAGVIIFIRIRILWAYRDESYEYYQLKGKWLGWSECFIKPDLIVKL